MDKEIMTPQTLALLEVKLAELSILRDEFPNIERYEERNVNALRRVQITREISELLGYNVKEDELANQFKTDLNDK